jgi:hypothetical protein
MVLESGSILTYRPTLDTSANRRVETHKVHHTIAATRQMEARKFLASLSYRVATAKVFGAAERVFDAMPQLVRGFVEADLFGMTGVVLRPLSHCRKGALSKALSPRSFFAALERPIRPSAMAQS